jgi:hypothetical protein
MAQNDTSKNGDKVCFGFEADIFKAANSIMSGVRA